ncbi:MAG: rhodanese-like domain-containing protein [Bacteroidota bacterium]|nr:rhodanese-like domain-containing protein [Bacteroidota bacterium]
MFDIIKSLFGIEKTDFAQLVAEGAIILDVRTKGEYSTGHIKGSINIPVEKLRSNLNKLRNKDNPIITCCASGVRSASAKSILKTNGYVNVHNGGAWHSLNRKIN